MLTVILKQSWKTPQGPLERITFTLNLKLQSLKKVQLHPQGCLALFWNNTPPCTSKQAVSFPVLFLLLINRPLPEGFGLENSSGLTLLVQVPQKFREFQQQTKVLVKLLPIPPRIAWTIRQGFKLSSDLSVGLFQCFTHV